MDKINPKLILFLDVQENGLPVGDGDTPMSVVLKYPTYDDIQPIQKAYADFLKDLWEKNDQAKEAIFQCIKDDAVLTYVSNHVLPRMQKLFFADYDALEVPYIMHHLTDKSFADFRAWCYAYILPEMVHLSLYDTEGFGKKSTTQSDQITSSSPSSTPPDTPTNKPAS